ncbi:HSP20-like chaperone [Schizothecium vesticola]|uniref:HSP20-like chaperone n=1 Tax=Schizothecium vesticola TaxID=314040 RepID=A0AA40FCA9_9PEZI|nr:HSP20-like chaperone [Schizothecium vesticola]
MRTSRTLLNAPVLLSRPLKPTPSAITKAYLSTKPPNMSSLWFPRSLAHPHSNPSGFSSLFKMLDDFERYSNQDGQLEGARGTDAAGVPQGIIAPKFDVAEHDKAYHLQGELPGVPPENVVLEFTDPQTLVVRGKAERSHTEGDPSLAPKRIGGVAEQGKIDGEKEEKGEQQQGEKKGGKETESKGGASKPKYWLSERSYGEFSRVFSFPSSVDQDKVEAKFENGVLNVIVPKVEKKGTRRIEIK